MAAHTLNVAQQAQGKLYVVMAMLAIAKVGNLADRLAAL